MQKNEVRKVFSKNRVMIHRYCSFLYHTAVALQEIRDNTRISDLEKRQLKLLYQVNQQIIDLETKYDISKEMLQSILDEFLVP